jgi:hypothetical protein
MAINGSPTQIRILGVGHGIFQINISVFARKEWEKNKTPSRVIDNSIEIRTAYLLKASIVSFHHTNQYI